MAEIPAQHAVLGQLAHLANRDGSSCAALEIALDTVLLAFDCQAGTIHGLDAASGMLNLRVSRGIPETIMPRIQLIPIGKGMAGIAAERRKPVQVCNLQCDTSGIVRSAARETKMEGSIAVPILDGQHLRGTLGVAKPVPYEFSAAESELLLKVAAAIGRLLGS